MRKLNSPHQSATAQPRGSAYLFYIKLLNPDKTRPGAKQKTITGNLSVISCAGILNTQHCQPDIHNQVWADNMIMQQFPRLFGSVIMTHACAPAPGDLCDLNSTSMPIRVWAWYYGVRRSQRPAPPPRGVLQHNAVCNRQKKKSVKHFISRFSRTWVIIFLSADWNMLFFSLKVWQLMSIICKTERQRQGGSVTRLEMEGTIPVVGFSGSNKRS